MTGTDVALVLPWLVVALMLGVGYALVRQIGRVLLRLEAIEARLAVPTAERRNNPAPPPGLPRGTPAPDFALPDLAGKRHTLAEYRRRAMLLVFFNPKCGFCVKMAPDLGTLSTEPAGNRPATILVTSGELADNLALIEEHGIRLPVLMQLQREVAAKYHAPGTPMGYLIDPQGRIASERAVGAEALLKLARATLPPAVESSQNPAASHAAGENPTPRKGDRSLANSRLNRSGLKAGALAPDFRLPRLDRGELALSDFRGRRVLLVFSDPECGPCEALARRLQELHQNGAAAALLMVSRREVERNRAKAASLGLTFPVVLQRQWEISLLYGMFATPIGYLIDEQGVIQNDVAVGVEPILSLLAGPPAATNGHTAAPLSTRELSLAARV
jgi:peroxiredoxin